MPIYEYLCRGCGTRNEFLEGVTQERTERACEECGGKDLHKLISMTSFVVSGGSEACDCEQGGGCCGGGGCCMN